MLDKFKTPQLFDRTSIDVIRHRSRGALLTVLAVVSGTARRWLTEAGAVGRHWLTVASDRYPVLGNGRGRGLLAAATALVFITGGALLANAAVSDPAPTPPGTTTAAESVLADRNAAAGAADRGVRPHHDGGGSQGTEPQPSPSPDQDSEPESEQTSQPDSEQGSGPESGPTPESTQTEQEQADWVHPMPGTATTSCFGWRWGAQHAGVDLAGPHGTPIQAVGAGTVTHAGWVFSGYGISVVIDHHDGHYTHYAHASEVKVKPGDEVSPGQVIALEGSTGDSTGPHLHFEVHKGGLWNQVEPTQWMANRGVTIGGC